MTLLNQYDANNRYLVSIDYVRGLRGVRHSCDLRKVAPSGGKFKRLVALEQELDAGLKNTGDIKRGAGAGSSSVRLSCRQPLGNGFLEKRCKHR